ncbi:hypothetical protein KXW16_006716, partial [Aspergillus fumigatus]
GRGLGVGANETVWGRVVAPDGVGIQTHDLLACVAAPEEDPMDATEQAVQFLGFYTPGPPSILGKQKWAPWEDEAEVSRMERQHQLATIDLEAATQRMTRRPDMQFRGVQDPAMRVIQQGESPVVAVMPTGGGKSMLFMVPAFAAPGGTTIIIVPLVTLQADMMQRCQELSISYVA